MFITELSPLFAELVQKPVAFAGGFVSGLLRLNLSDDPVRQWLDKQMGMQTTSAGTTATPGGSNGKSGPQSISIE
jgi:hypothetical protein